MSTPRAKRALNFGPNTPNKRSKNQNTMVLYRGIKPEMKHASVSISHSTALASDLCVNAIPNGTSFENRIGAKIKIWNVEYFVAEYAGTPVTLKLDMYLGDTSTDFSTHLLANAFPREKYTLLKTIVATPHGTPNQDGVYGNHRLPLGVVTRYNSTTAASIVDNAINVRIQTSTATTVAGYFRIWYTDA